MTGERGECVADGAGRVAVRFRRHFDVGPEALWAMVATPEGLGAWLAPATIDLRPGGMVHLRFSGDDPAHHVQGRILSLDPPHRLSFEWRFPTEDESMIEYVLHPSGSGTDLRLEHRLLSEEMGRGYTPGWHAYLDRLEGTLRGEAVDWMARYQEVAPLYA